MIHLNTYTLEMEELVSIFDKEIEDMKKAGFRHLKEDRENRVNDKVDSLDSFFPTSFFYDINPASYILQTRFQSSDGFFCHVWIAV